MTSQTIDLEVIPKGVRPILYVSQYDVGQTWIFNLHYNGNLFSIPAGSTVYIQGTKADGTGFQYTCTYSGAVVTAMETDQMTIYAGDVATEIVVTKDDDILGTLNFIVRVEPTTLPSDIDVSKSDIPLIEARAEEFALDSEAYAVGTRDGVVVGPTDPAYHYNSKWFADIAAAIAQNPAYIGVNGDWYIWDMDTSQYVDSGVLARAFSIVSITKVSTSGLTDTYRILFNDGTHQDYAVTNGKGITSIAKTTTSGLSDVYTISFNDGTSQQYIVTNGKGISSITKTGSSGLTDIYTITFNDGATQTYTVANGKGISTIEKVSTSGLTDTYQITYNDGSDQDYTVTNGKGIVSIAKTGTSGLIDTYTITYNDGSTSTYQVRNGADGTGAGDMTKLVYDSDNAVADEGGIADYVHNALITDAQWSSIQAILS